MGEGAMAETPRPIHVEPSGIPKGRLPMALVIGAVVMLAAVGVAIWLASSSKEGPGPETRSAKAPFEPPAITSPPPMFTNSIGMKFVLVPKGTFWMSENGWNARRQVEIPHDFYMGVYEVTQGQWQAVMGNNPSHFSRTGRGADKVKEIPDAELNQFPVDLVSWNDVHQFSEELNRRENQSGDWLYRLPTEAEWEYACRGGASSKEDCSFDFYFKNNPTNSITPELANYKESNLGHPAKVGSYPENALGLHDMHGNVWEWCRNWDIEGFSRPYRGGCWFYPASYGRVAKRFGYPPRIRDYRLGFRLALVPSRRN
jgi:formylglycine-generating enzyme required for sulfatase activity